MSILRRLRLPLAAVGLAALLFGAGVVGTSSGAQSGSATVVMSNGDLQSAITALQARTRLVPKDAAAWAALGFTYVEHAKAAVLPDAYPEAERALRRSLLLQPEDNFAAAAGMSALAAARHRFPQARTWAQRGLAINPSNAALYGALADAETQLGNYEAATVAIQRMLDINPDSDAFARASYSWELRGNTEQARAMMERALESAASPNQEAFAQYYLGELALNSADGAEALRRFDAGLLVAPNYAALYEGRAKARFALGDERGALRDFASAVERAPLPSYLIEYGELLESLGRIDDANRQYQAFVAAQREFAANGELADVDPTLFEADHGNPARALRLGRAGLETRQFVALQDAYAWALHRNGRHAEALTWITKAMSVGTKSALFEFHAGAIHSSLGNIDQARGHFAAALAINPAFSPIHAPEARAALLV